MKKWVYFYALLCAIAFFLSLALASGVGWTSNQFIYDSSSIVINDTGLSAGGGSWATSGIFEACVKMNINTNISTKLQLQPYAYVGSNSFLPYATIRTRYINMTLIEELNSTNEGFPIVKTSLFYTPATYYFCVYHFNSSNFGYMYDPLITTNQYFFFRNDNFSSSNNTDSIIGFNISYPYNSNQIDLNSSQTQTRYLSIPYGLNITSAFFNISNVNISENVTGLGYSVGGTTYYNYSYNANMYYNTGAKLYYIPCPDIGDCSSTPTSSYDIPQTCINPTINIKITGGTKTVFYCLNNTNGYDTLGGSTMFNDYKGVSLVTKNHTRNLNISIDKTSFFYNAENLTQFNKTINFTSVLNTYLATCSYSTNNCIVPFNFNSLTRGNIRYYDIAFQGEEYVKPNLTIYEPNQTYNLITYVPLKFKAVDNYLLDKCWYNITRGASLEIDNTYTSCYANTTFTVSGSANYILRMCINDTSGNQNCTTSNFTTTNYILPPETTSSGGGGGLQQAVLDIFNKTRLSGAVCDAKYPALTSAWSQFVNDYSFSNFKIFWLAFWDYVPCKSAGSIVPF